MQDRELFSLDPGIHYLNNAYMAPLLRSSERAAQEVLQQMRDPFQIGPTDFFQSSETVKQLFGKLVNAHAASIAIIPSVSYGFANALANVRAHGRTKAITLHDEFPSGYFAIERWCRDHHVRLEKVNCTDHTRIGASWNEALLSAIDEETAVVLLSSVHWMHGVRFDLKAIGKRCAEVGAFFMVDGTQSVGALPIDLSDCNIDALVCAGYKWLLGPYSIGLAYYAPRLQSGKPIEESWMNRFNAMNFSRLTQYSNEYASGSARFSVGESSHFIQLPMLIEGLRQVLEWDPSGIQAHAAALTKPLFDRQRVRERYVEALPYRAEHLFGLSLSREIDAPTMSERLIKANVYVSVRGTSLRVAVNKFNTSDDVAALVEVLDEMDA